MKSDEKREFKDRLFEQFERIGQGLASARRLELLEVLAQGEWSVESLARETSMSVSNTSRHLQILRDAEMATARRDGVTIYYKLADEHVFHVWQALRKLAEARLVEIERIVGRFLVDRKAFEPVGLVELRDRLNTNGVVLLDVRSESEYRFGHIAGARSIPVTELEKRLGEIPKDKEIVAYCRGPYCVFADQAISILIAQGYHASRLELGFPDWQALGFPVERIEGR